MYKLYLILQQIVKIYKKSNQQYNNKNTPIQYSLSKFDLSDQKEVRNIILQNQLQKTHQQEIYGYSQIYVANLLKSKQIIIMNKKQQNYFEQHFIKSQRNFQQYYYNKHQPNIQAMQNSHINQNFNMPLTQSKQTPPTFNASSNSATLNPNNQTFFHKYSNPTQRSQKSNSLVFTNNKGNAFKNQLLNCLSPQSKTNISGFGQNENTSKVDFTKNVDNFSVATHNLPKQVYQSVIVGSNSQQQLNTQNLNSSQYTNFSNDNIMSYKKTDVMHSAIFSRPTSQIENQFPTFTFDKNNFSKTGEQKQLSNKLRSQLSFNDNLSKKNLVVGSSLQFTKKSSAKQTKNSGIFDNSTTTSLTRIQYLPENQKFNTVTTLNKQTEIATQNIFKKKKNADIPQVYEANNTFTSSLTLNQVTKTSPTVKQFKKSDFQIGKKMGKGQFGQVELVRHKQSGFICGLKTMSKKQIRQQKYQNQIARELSIQFYLSHRNITPLYGFFSDQSNVYLLVEFCPDGHLLNILKKVRRMEQEEVSPIIKQICEGIDYIHKEKIIHRDIKPENILFSSGVAKITDFGWSVYRGMGMRKTASGSPLYYSPQIVMGSEYDQKIDIWDIGMMTYECLIGKIPFRVYTEMDLNKIVQDQVKFPDYVDVTQQAKDFILKILQKKPQNRATIKQMLRHPFITKYASKKPQVQLMKDLQPILN